MLVHGAAGPARLQGIARAAQRQERHRDQRPAGKIVRARRESEQPPEDQQRVAHVLRPEEHPHQAHEGRRQRRRSAAPPGARFRRESPCPQLVGAQRQPVQRAPDHEGHVRAVPQAAQRHGDHQVQIGTRRAAAVAAERYVQVLLQPAGQADVPALPEFADVPGNVGPVEVHRQVVAQAARRAGGHVGVAGEIEVDLHGVGDHRQRHRGRAVGAHRREHRIGEHRHLVGQHRLLEHAVEQLRQPAEHPPGRGPAVLLQLGQEFRRLHDRPGHQLREERDVQRELQRVAAGAQPAPVHVDGIAQALERVERYAHRQYDPQRARPPHAEGGAESAHEKVHVLEEEQHQQRHRHAHGQYPPAAGPPFHAQARQIGHRRQKQHQAAEPPVPPAVEHVAGRQQQRVPGAGVPHHRLRQQHGGEKHKECDADKAHVVSPSACRIAR